MEFVCKNCGNKVHRRFKSQVLKTVFCSHKCYSDHKTKNKNEIKIYDDCAEIVIKSRKFGDKTSKIDLEDVWKIKDIKWCLSHATTKINDIFYVRSTKFYGNKYLHSHLISCDKDNVINHKNFDTLDNRKANLEIVSKSYNSSYKDPSKIYASSGEKHISKSGDRYVFEIKRKGKRVIRQGFKTLEEAKSFKQKFTMSERFEERQF